MAHREQQRTGEAVTLPRKLPKHPKRDGRLRCPAHLAWVRSHGCCVPGCKTTSRIEAAHVRTGTGGGMGMKPGDEWTISLCRQHHADQHSLGEPAFGHRHQLDLRALAAEFAAKSPALARQRAKDRVSWEGFGG